ncbi:MAG: energy-coupling factor transporter transmembrane protein EcfT, partial [Ruminococcaceae bacterium]|nr:energy-coupling factor transporter transmembrane protein EcfT [Oscillospiraceae bacterium]
MKQLNPGYKFLTILIATLLLSLTYRTLVNTVVFAVTVSIVLLTPGVNRKRMFFAFLPVLLTAAGLFMSGLLFPAEGAGDINVSVFGQTTLYATSLNSALLLATRVLAFAGIGMMFALTTDAEEFIIS